MDYGLCPRCRQQLSKKRKEVNTHLMQCQLVLLMEISRDLDTAVLSSMRGKVT